MLAVGGHSFGSAARKPTPACAYLYALPTYGTRRVPVTDQPLRAAVFSPVEKHVAYVAGEDGSIRAWDCRGNAELWVLKSDLAPISILAVRHDARLLAGGSDDGLIRLWDLESQELLRTYGGLAGNITTLSFSPDGQRLLAGANDGYFAWWSLPDGVAKAP